MYLTTTDDYWIIDIEGNGLHDCSRVWVMCYENAKTTEKGYLTEYTDIRKWFADHPNGKFVGHNILKYDAPTLNRIVGCRIPIGRCVDTLVLSNLYNPSLAGGHSLTAWGQRLKYPKIDFNDWEKFSDEMLKYCEQDVSLTKLLYTKLVHVLKKIEFSEKSCELQHKMTHIIAKQQKNGFYFDAAGAMELRAKILKELNELKEKIYVKFPKKLEKVARYKRAYKQDGTFSKQYEKHLEQFAKLVLVDEGEYEAYDWVEFNLASPQQRVSKLLALGWVPEEFTPKTPKGGGGNPQPTKKGELSPSLARFAEESGIEEVALIAQWMALNGRATMLGTWLDEWNPTTGCIHGQIWTAQTLRFRHDHPNTANIPAVRTTKDGSIVYAREGYYTFEARNLWRTRDPETRTLVGTDAKALEYRMLAHHVNNPELTEVVLSRDVHQFTADMAGVSRAGGKTLNFAIIYGSGDAKAGSIVGGSAKDGKLLKEKLFANIPGLGEAIAEAKAEFNRGRVILVDGSRIVCPAKHAAFNYKLQGGGARVMFQAAIFLEGYIRRHGLDSLKVGDIHDEWQYDVAKSDAEEHAKWANQALVDAGEELNMNIPMAGESKMGLTWALTH